MFIIKNLTTEPLLLDGVKVPPDKQLTVGHLTASMVAAREAGTLQIMEWTATRRSRSAGPILRRSIRSSPDIMKHVGLWRAFDLSAWGYFLDFGLVPMAVVILVLTDAFSVGLVAIGFAVWTLAEYWIHRLVFHGATPFEAMHQMHHALPKDMIGVASWGTFAGFAIVWLVLGSMFCIGFMLGYLCYCTIHVRMHHGDQAKFSRYVAFMNRHHSGHHRGGRGNFGVSSPVWDFVFATYKGK